MRVKLIAGGLLIAFGSIIAFTGALNENQSMINAGIGGAFIGIVILTFSTPDYIKREVFDTMIPPYTEFARKTVDSLQLNSNAVYIPPYQNLPQQGIFIPLHENFDIDLARLDDSIFFLTDVGREKEMGLLLPPMGKELLGRYEEYSEIEFTGAPNVVEYCSAVLKSLGLADSVIQEEENGNIRIKIHVKLSGFCSQECAKVPCPICSSILLAISKSQQELIIVDSFELNEAVEITARKLGGVSEWM